MARDRDMSTIAASIHDERSVRRAQRRRMCGRLPGRAVVVGARRPAAATMGPRRIREDGTIGCWGEAVRGLGELEAAVMDVLWGADRPLKVRDVLDRLDTGKSLAYTTVMTVLDNLYRKSWAHREMVDRAWQYRPTRSRPEASAQALREVLDSSGDPEAVLMHFATSVSEQESEVLRRALRRKAPRR